MIAIKTALTSALLGCWLASCSSANKPNERVEKAFVEKFGHISQINWTENADYSFAHFTQDGKQVVVVFGNDGQLIATEPARPIR